jgi:DNA processing protein
MIPDLAPWALAFSMLPWPERQKAAAWAALEQGQKPSLPEDAQALWARLPQLREEARERGAMLCLPGEEGLDRLLSPLPYPLALWVRGKLPPPAPTIAIVGARKASRVALDRAHHWAGALAKAGVSVISGLARGIDGAAHQGALDVGAGTWGVMGSGLDHPYPPEHRGLMDRMVAAGGGVITPFPPGAKPLKWHFPRRNVLIAAWCDAVLVVQAELRSGSLVTAKLALDHGKELFVVPGSPGPDALIEEGAAHACDSLESLLAAWGL